MKRINLLLIMLAFIALGCNQGAKDEEKLKQELKDEIRSELEAEMNATITADIIKKISFFGADNPPDNAWKIEFYEEYGIYGWPNHLVRFFYIEDNIDEHKNLSDIIDTQSAESVSINVVNELGLQNIIVIYKESCKCKIHDEIFPYRILWDEREGCGLVKTDVQELEKSKNINENKTSFTSEEIKNADFFASNYEWTLKFYENYALKNIRGDFEFKLFYIAEGNKEHRNLSEMIKQKSSNSITIRVMDEVLEEEALITITREMCSDGIYDYPYSYQRDNGRNGCGAPAVKN